MTQPDVPYCWPVDHGCCDGWENYPPEVQQRSDLLAVQVLYGLTGGRVGGCEQLLRPCPPSCAAQAPSTFWGLGPYSAGSAMGYAYLLPCTCHTDPCSCTRLCQVKVPTRWVVEVVVDGASVPDDAWRIDSPSWLVRTDGGCWPDCQDLAAPPTQEGTWAVRYLPGAPPDAVAQYAAGQLACEFAKACQPRGKCALPSGVVSMVRGGVSITFSAMASLFASGSVGIREVDAWLSIVNRTTSYASVRSPDVAPARVTLPKVSLTG